VCRARHTTKRSRQNFTTGSASLRNEECVKPSRLNYKANLYSGKLCLTQRYTNKKMITPKHKKILSLFQSRFFQLLWLIPISCFLFACLYLFVGWYLGKALDIHLIELIKVSIQGVDFETKYSGEYIIAIQTINKAFFQYCIAVSTGVLVFFLSKVRKLFKEIIIILKKHNEW
jgi:hypothetical protein